MYKVLSFLILVIATLMSCNNEGSLPNLRAYIDSTGQPHLVISPTKQGDTVDAKLYMLLDGKRAPAPIVTIYNSLNDCTIVSPKFKVDAGAEVVFVYHYQKDSMQIQLTLPVNAEENVQPCVVNIYPRSDTIPINTLMFHATFSEPMNEDILAYMHVKLFDNTGKEKEMVWRENSGWTSDGKHLVMMIHPGWVKREIHYLNTYGPSFERGKKYTLVIQAELKGRNGKKLCREFKKEFVIGEADRKSPKLHTTQLPTLSPNSKDAVKLQFNENIDYGSAVTSLFIKDTEGNKIKGNWQTNDEKEWSFMPEHNWAIGNYHVEITEELSDVASNHLHRLFEETDINKMKSVPPKTINFSCN